MGSDWPDWLRWRPRTALRLSDHPIERGTWSPSWTRAWTQKARGGTASSDQSHRSLEPARNIATTVLAPPDLRRGRPHCPRAPIDFATTITGGGVGIANRPRIVRSANSRPKSHAVRNGKPIQGISRKERVGLFLHRSLDKRLSPLGVWVYQWTRGGITRPWKVDALLLTTRGRRSGRERTVVLQFFPGGNAMVVAAANGGGASHPGWYFNLKADPVARVEVMGRTIAVRAAELPADEAAAWWQRILRRDPSYERYPRGPAARSRSSAWSPPPRRAERVRKRPPKPRSSGASARDTMIVSLHVAYILHWGMGVNLKRCARCLLYTSDAADDLLCV